MSITWGERPKQEATVEFNKGSVSREYWVSGTLDKVAVLATIAVASPKLDTTTDDDGIPISVIRKTITAKEDGGGNWTVPVTYSNTVDQWDLKINNGVQSVKMLQALETVMVYDCIDGGSFDGQGDFSANLPDFKNAIGVTDQGVDGVDAEIGKLEFSITKTLQMATLDAGYEAYLSTVTPSKNDAVWSFVWKGQAFIFGKGCVLLRGHTTDAKSDDTISITHNFAFSKGINKPADPWSGSTTYASGDRATYGGRLLESLANGNVNNQPVMTAWTFDATFGAGDKVTYGSPASVYESIGAGNTGNRPDISPGSWTDLGLYEWSDVGADTSFRIGNSDPIVKEGWDYGWPYYRPGVSTSGILVPVPTGFIVSRVYDASDFGELQVF